MVSDLNLNGEVLKERLIFFDAKSDVESLLSLSGNDYLFEAAEHPALQVGSSSKNLYK